MMYSLDLPGGNLYLISGAIYITIFTSGSPNARVVLEVSESLTFQNYIQLTANDVYYDYTGRWRKKDSLDIHLADIKYLPYPNV